MNHFEGHDQRTCGEHRTVGEHRAWCYDCGEWCYPNTPCRGCARLVPKLVELYQKWYHYADRDELMAVGLRSAADDLKAVLEGCGEI